MRRQSVPAFFMRRGGSDTDFYNGSRRTFLKKEVIKRVKHFGDIERLHGWELPVVDVITGGSPC